MNDNDCGAIGGMLGRGNRSTRRRPAPMLLCSPQIPHDLTRARIQADAVGSQRLPPELRHGLTLYVPHLHYKFQIVDGL
jgi:hypothetical protein